MNEYKVIVTDSLIDLINQVSEIDKNLKNEKLDILYFSEAIDVNKFFVVYRIVDAGVKTLNKSWLGL